MVVLRANPVVTVTVGGLSSVDHLRVIGWVNGLAPEVGSALIEALDGSRLNYGDTDPVAGACELPNAGAAVTIRADGVTKWSGKVVGVRFMADRQRGVRVLIECATKAIDLAQRGCLHWQEAGGFELWVPPTINADGAGDMAASGNQSDRSGAGTLWTARKLIETYLQRAGVPLTLVDGGLLEFSSTMDPPIGDVHRQIAQVLGTRSGLAWRVDGSLLRIMAPLSGSGVIANLTSAFIVGWDLGYNAGGSWGQVRALGQPLEVTTGLTWIRAGGGHLVWDGLLQDGSLVLSGSAAPFGPGIANVPNATPRHLLRLAGGVPIQAGDAPTYSPAGQLQYPMTLWVHRIAATINAPAGWSPLPCSLSVLERGAGVKLNCDDLEPLLIDQMVLVATLVLPQLPQATAGGGMGPGLLPIQTECRRAVVNAGVPYAGAGEVLQVTPDQVVLVDTTDDLLRTAQEYIAAVGTARWSGGWTESFFAGGHFPPGTYIQGVTIPGRSLPVEAIVTTESVQNTELGVMTTISISALPNDDRALKTRQVMA